MPQTPRLALPLIAAGQSQKDVTHNDALLALDRLVALAAQSATEAVPPANPADGAVWIVPTAGVAAWGQAAGTLMHRQGEAWIAEPPRDGQLAVVNDVGQLLVHAGGWHAVRRVGALSALTLPAGGAMVDAEARAAVASIRTILQVHGFVT